jgi:hypothetical protein
MNDFFNKYADLTALTLTLLTPLVFTIFLKRKARKRLRALPTYFLLFGPGGILAFIFFHLFENTYRAIENAINGSFEYTFRFYALILFGLVLAHLGFLFLKASVDKCLAEPKSNRSYLYKVLLVLIVTLPLIPITPIAAVPLICCSISVLAFPFVLRKLESSKSQSSYHTSITSVTQMAYER